MKKIRAIVCILLALIPVFMGVRLSHGETEPPDHRTGSGMPDDRPRGTDISALHLKKYKQ